MFEYDKSSKWLIQKHGNGILYLGGVRKVHSWRPLQAELVQPRFRGQIEGFQRLFPHDAVGAQAVTRLKPAHRRLDVGVIDLAGSDTGVEIPGRDAVRVGTDSPPSLEMLHV